MLMLLLSSFHPRRASDVTALKDILLHFGMVTNLDKSTVAPICCRGIDLQAVLTDFPATHTNFPFMYLGLPLTLTRLKKVDCQQLLDKAAGRLAHWRGRLLNQVGRNTLVKAVGGLEQAASFFFLLHVISF